MIDKRALKSAFFLSGATSALFALIAISLKVAKVVTEFDGWLFYGIGMTMWGILMVCGFVIRED